MSKDKYIFPRATEESKKIGWTLDYDFLDVIMETARKKWGDSMSGEQIEAVLLSAEEWAAKNTVLFQTEAGDG